MAKTRGAFARRGYLFFYIEYIGPLYAKAAIFEKFLNKLADEAQWGRRRRRRRALYLRTCV